MSKLVLNITMSLDGFVAGPNQSLEQPLGEGGERLHDWMFKLKYWREMHGEEGGETGPSDTALREVSASVGAYIMGRNMFGGGKGPWSEPAWKGWWGDNPPYHTPVFVVTHHPRAALAMQGGTTFSFVTDGIESALEQAKKAAGTRDVALIGGASIVNQYLGARLIDEMELHVAPLLLGSGARLFEDLGSHPPQLRLLRTIPAADVTHLRYRVVK